jgi:hypothetical protein
MLKKHDPETAFQGKSGVRWAEENPQQLGSH